MSSIPALAKALLAHEALVRSHAAWALGRLGGQESEAALRTALAQEEDADVLQEIELALADCREAARSV